MPGRPRLEFKAKNHVIAALFRREKYTTELRDRVSGHGEVCGAIDYVRFFLFLSVKKNMKAQGKNYVYIISAPPSALGNGVKVWKCGSIWNYANEGLPNPHLSQLGSLEVWKYANYLKERLSLNCEKKAKQVKVD